MKLASEDDALPSADHAFDRADLLERAAGDEELARDLLAIFSSNLPSNVNALRMAVVGIDLVQVCQSAHRIKGALLAVSATPSARAAEQLELAARAGQCGRIPALWSELSALLEILETALSREVA
ncbi:MAG: hybrid sensor histidine kinase/response regulator [Myxococcaceae bacterium]|nr:hybrid sensor histidine kinase/response regulator [Myxococcaceae bacterium]